MTSTYTFKEIQKATGLKTDFLRKVYKANQEIFEPHITRGSNNSLLFNSNGYTLFDQVKQKKESGANIPEISKFLKNSGDQSVQSATQTPQNPVSKPEPENVSERFMEKVNAVYALAIEAKEETIATQKLQISDLRSSLLLLTDGRSPEEIKQQREEQAKAIQASQQEAERISSELSRVQTEKSTVEKQHKETLEELNNERHKAEQALKRAQILEEMQKLPFYASARRKALRKELETLTKVS